MKQTLAVPKTAIVFPKLWPKPQTFECAPETLDTVHISSIPPPPAISPSGILLFDQLNGKLDISLVEPLKVYGIGKSSVVLSWWWYSLTSRRGKLL